MQKHHFGACVYMCSMCINFYNASLFDRSYKVQFYLHILAPRSLHIFCTYVEKMPSTPSLSNSETAALSSLLQHCHPTQNTVRTHTHTHTCVHTLGYNWHNILLSQKIYYTVQYFMHTIYINYSINGIVKLLTTSLQK